MADPSNVFENLPPPPEKKEKKKKKDKGDNRRGSDASVSSSTTTSASGGGEFGGAPPKSSKKEKGGNAAPPPMMPMMGGAGGKPGWRRVSTRQWIRDFRDNISKYQTYPYKPICGIFFWSFGYYPDMIPEETYQKYIAKYPPTNKPRKSGGSGEVPYSTTASSAVSSTAPSKNVSKTDLGSAADDNANQDEVPAPSSGKKKKDKTAKATDSKSSLGSEKNSKTGKKKKKKGGEESTRGSIASEASAATEASEGASESKKKKKKKDKKGDDGADDASSMASESTTAEEGGEGKKSKKKKKKGGKDNDAASAISGNIAFDPAVYDLSTLTVMNLPEGATAGKLKKLFPGATVTMEGGGASVAFPDVAAAQPYFTKNVSIDGQSLVISPKLKG